jgi:G3E family GTPase
VLRAKGIVRFAGRDWHCLFNFTCGRHELTWLRLEGAAAPSENQAVFIGRNLDRHRPRIEAELAACETEEKRRVENG